MTKFTNKSYDVCAVGNWDNTIAIGNTAAAAQALTVSLPGAAGLTTYITGFQVTTTNPAATVNGVVTVTGLTANGGGGTLSYQLVESATLGGTLNVTFANPIPANGVNAAINVVVPAIASGGAVAVNVQGYQTAY